MPDKVLIVVTSSGRVPATEQESNSGIRPGRDIGFDWQSIAVPYWRLREAGKEVSFASPRGGKPEGDAPTGMDPKTGDRSGAVEMMLGDETAVMALAESNPLSTVRADEWDGILIADGSAVPWDLYASDSLAALISEAASESRVVAAIGYGAAALAAVRDSEGRSLVAGRRMTSARDEDIDAAVYPSSAALPEARLSAAGAMLQCAPRGKGAIVVEDGLLITADDSRASADLALQMLDALDARAVPV